MALVRSLCGAPAHHMHRNGSSSARRACERHPQYPAPPLASCAGGSRKSGARPAHFDRTVGQMKDLDGENRWRCMPGACLQRWYRVAKSMTDCACSGGRGLRLGPGGAAPSGRRPRPPDPASRRLQSAVCRAEYSYSSGSCDKRSARWSLPHFDGPRHQVKPRRGGRGSGPSQATRSIHAGCSSSRKSRGQRASSSNAPAAVVCASRLEITGVDSSRHLRDTLGGRRAVAHRSSRRQTSLAACWLEARADERRPAGKPPVTEVDMCSCLHDCARIQRPHRQ